ncbi:hypothetical protein [Sulfurimonas sp. HSL3-7]|uniref:hypothetical protein n=1 Tax=Sulfonitrofixus jiaomeiensis TaxID=3131938 RepID=UPI0031F9B030
MRPVVYAVFFMLATALLCASDTNQSETAIERPISDGSFFYSDNNSSEDINGTRWFSLPDFISGRSWLYYHGFLSGMDTVYFYGTDIVIVLGSGIDYSIYRLFSSDKNVTTQTDINLTAGDDVNMTELIEAFEDGEDNDSMEQFISSPEGQVPLAKQRISQKKDKSEQDYFLSQWLYDNVNHDYLDRKNPSFIRLRGGYAFDYRGENGYIYSITARVLIPRTQEKLDLVIGDETKNSSDLSLEGTEAERNTSIALGVNDVFTMIEPVKSKILVGFSGITNPYAKAAFDYEALFGTWLVVPHQVFKYSVEAKFEEWTNLDFRHRFSDKIVSSMLFQRSTESRTDGMEYFMQPSVNFRMGWYGNITPYLGIYGRTKKQPEDKDGYRPKRGLYRYATGINWSRKGPRKYIVYRLQPILYYDDKYKFQPNYYVKALLEFYFGVRD